MSQSTRSLKFDAIDAMIDDLMRNPAQSNAVKEALKAQLGEDNIRQMPLNVPDRDAMEIDDLWDNVPI